MKILDITKGIAGIGFVQLADQLPTPDQLAEILKIAVQIIIAVATLVSLFKKKKQK